MLTYQLGPLTFIWGQFSKSYLSHQSLKSAWKLLFSNFFQISQGQWVKHRESNPWTFETKSADALWCKMVNPFVVQKILTPLGLVTHLCIIELVQHCFRLMASCLTAPSLYWTNVVINKDCEIHLMIISWKKVQGMTISKIYLKSTYSKLHRLPKGPTSLLLLINQLCILLHRC